MESVEYKDSKTLFVYIKELNKKGYIFFSSSTFFTIGYGDIVPRGEYLRTIIIIEMIISHFLSISIFALFSVLFYDFIKGKKIKQLDYLTIDEVSK